MKNIIFGIFHTWNETEFLSSSCKVNLDSQTVFDISPNIPPTLLQSNSAFVELPRLKLKRVVLSRDEQTQDNLLLGGVSLC